MIGPNHFHMWKGAGSVCLQGPVTGVVLSSSRYVGPPQYARAFCSQEWSSTNRTVEAAIQVHMRGFSIAVSRVRVKGSHELLAACNYTWRRLGLLRTLPWRSVSSEPVILVMATPRSKRWTEVKEAFGVFLTRELEAIVTEMESYERLCHAPSPRERRTLKGRSKER